MTPRKPRIRLYYSRGHHTVFGYEYTIYGYLFDLTFILNMEIMKNKYPEFAPWSAVPCDLFITKDGCFLTKHSRLHDHYSMR